MTAHLTNIKNQRGPMRKGYSLDDNGGLVKHQAASLFDGLAQTFTFPDLAAFLDRLKRALPNEAFVYGVPKNPSTRIGCLSSPAVKSGEAQARARESFEWAGRSILMIDCDGVSMDWTAAHKAITACHAGLAGAACVVSHSASAGLYQTSTGRQLTGLDSFHFYWIVDSGPRIPEFVNYLHKALWASGHGRIAIGKAGTLLERSLIDVTSAQPERLDYVARSRLGPDIERRAPEPLLLPGKPFAAIGNLPDIPGHEARVHRAKQAPDLIAEAAAIRASYIASKIAFDMSRGISESESQKRWQSAIETQRLEPSHPIEFADGSYGTVQDIMDNPAAFEGKRCADPVEPDYHGDKRIAIIYAGSGVIYSHAHHGITYRFRRVHFEDFEDFEDCDSVYEECTGVDFTKDYDA